MSQALPTQARMADDFRDPWVWAIAALVAALHLATAGRYDFFRDELYFIICGRHPAIGYADQPPLVPLVAAATQAFGPSLFLLRLPAVALATFLVLLTAALARLLGGGRPAAVLAALAIAVSPAHTALTAIWGTSTPEPVGFTLCAYFVVRAALRADAKAWLWAAITAGLTLEAKYGIAIWVVGLAAGLIVTGHARALATRPVLLAVLIGAAIGLPSLVWQALHGWPFLAIVAFHSAEGRHFAGDPLAFAIQQALALNIVTAPLWLAGLIAPFFLRALRPARILSVAFLVTAVAILAAHGKDYYLFPAYPAVLAAGACAAARVTLWLRLPLAALAVLNAAFLAPITLPLLDPPALRHYIVHYHLAPPPNELAAIGATITQVFSDEFPWRSLAAQIDTTYQSLPPTERATTGIFAWNYGEAAAIDFYDHLSPTMSGEDQYFLWGPQGDPKTLILINANPDAWSPRCTTLDPVARFGAPYAMPYENDRPIFVCHGLKQPIAQIWDQLKFSREDFRL
jgi:hypothetical protein